MTAQLAMRLENTAPPFIVRANTDPRVLRAECDWHRTAEGYESSNGWVVKPAWLGDHRDAWAAFAPDGVAEWAALDPVTAMVRAEGGS